MRDQAMPGDVVMLGLAGFRVLRVAAVDGELEVTVETVEERTGCRGCGVVAALHDRREVVVRDVAAFGRRSRLRWRKRVWRCREAACATVTWTETHPEIAPRAVLSRRARQTACSRVGHGESGRSRRRRPGGGLAHRDARHVNHGAPLVNDPDRLAGVTALGMDETAFLRANRYHHQVRSRGAGRLGGRG